MIRTSKEGMKLIYNSILGEERREKMKEIPIPEQCKTCKFRNKNKTVMPVYTYPGKLVISKEGKCMNYRKEGGNKE